MTDDPDVLVTASARKSMPTPAAVGSGSVSRNAPERQAE
jgi:hypothetical protein